MRRIVHHRLGDPTQVLALADVAEPSIEDGMVLVRVTYAPMHPGYLLAIEGSPAFGPPPDIPSFGREPGFEGAGVVEQIGSAVPSSLGLRAGDAVAFFPANCTWSEKVAVPAASLVKLPETVPASIASHAIINVLTARVLVRAGLKASERDSLQGVPVIQTGAASAVGRLLTTLLLQAGALPLRIVRGAQSAQTLMRLHPTVPTVATQDPEWRQDLGLVLDGRRPPLAFDSVASAMIEEVGAFLEQGATILNYGSLGGPMSDLRAIVPRRLLVAGISFMQWADEPEAVRAADMAMALKLSRDAPELFDVAAVYDPSAVAAAAFHVREPGRSGSVLLRFS